MVLPQEWEHKDKDPGVGIVVDSRALSYSLRKTGRGGRAVDTVLDRVVFGEPVTPFDLYQRNKLFETSRRRNGECGLDVIVCGQAMTAYQAAETLVALAKEHFPDSDLANSAWTAPGVSVALEIRKRNVDSAPLRQFVPRLKDYCSNGRSIRDLKLALQKQKVFRKRVKDRIDADGGGELVVGLGAPAHGLLCALPQRLHSGRRQRDLDHAARARGHPEARDAREAADHVLP